MQAGCSELSCYCLGPGNATGRVPAKVSVPTDRPWGCLGVGRLQDRRSHTAQRRTAAPSPSIWSGRDAGQRGFL